MNVGQLRAALANLPDDMPVAIQSECGWSELNLYVLPANLYRSPHYPTVTYLSDGHVNTSSDVYANHTNTTALLFSEWGNDGENITPQAPETIDAEVIRPELGSGDQQ